MENYDEKAAVLISAVIGTRVHIDSPKVLWNGSIQAFQGTIFLGVSNFWNI